MEKEIVELACTVELQPGEKLSLPAELVQCVGAGRWLITVRSVNGSRPIRRHDAFLNGYAPEDEGLYDDSPAR